LDDSFHLILPMARYLHTSSPLLVNLIQDRDRLRRDSQSARAKRDTNLSEWRLGMCHLGGPEGGSLSVQASR